MSGDREQQPLLAPPQSDTTETLIQRAIRQTYESTANLANLLPTGTVLAFQVLAPILTNLGRCNAAGEIMTACFLALCNISCFLLTFTDSFRDPSGTVRYGFATPSGLWVIDGSAPPPPEVAVKYKIKAIDFAHAFMALLVFGAVALSDKNVVPCFFPVRSEEMRQALAALPVAIGVVGSMFFVRFPTTRHGIGFPLSAS